MSQPILSVRNVRKRFCRNLKRSLWYGISDIAGDLIGRPQQDLTLRRDEFLAVDDVSFDVYPGESVALIGRNGAGKSTLLKMVNGLFLPDAGEIQVNGRLAALIELGAGFNPVLSGRENIYVNAAVLGMTRREVDRRLEAIVEFAELSSFIDMPLKNYSSGMRVRLGFAVASQLEPDILLIDEVLAVGDAAFRAKCYRRLSELMEKGTAFVLVSHSHHTLLTVCQKGVAMERGRMFASGPVRETLESYESRLNASGSETISLPAHRQAVDGMPCQILDVFFRDEKGRVVETPSTGNCASFCVLARSPEPMDDVSLDVVIRSPGHGVANVLSVTAGQDEQRRSIPEGTFEYRLALNPVCLPPGQYTAKISLNRKPLHTLAIAEAISFNVSTGHPFGDSLFFNARDWEVVAA
ncbi:MAG: ABC transporter ATP-binding protein [Planctomycetaceae bacterium]|nr:ABC transporter ATP-binding protein [Planctomycetaceae bacterium]